MNRTAFYQTILALLFATLLLPASSAVVPTEPFISFSEEPVRILRNADFYLGHTGTRLQAGDIIDSGRGDLQLECGNGCTVALGPSSQLVVDSSSKGSHLVLLNGWLKVQSGAKSVMLRSTSVEIAVAESTLILHANGGTLELFVEKGEPWVEETDGTRVLRRTRFQREQYAQRAAGQRLKTVPRPPKEFIRSAPPVFLDALQPIPAKGQPSAARLERAATAADVAPWFVQEPALGDAVERRLQAQQKDKPAPERTSAQRTVADKKPAVPDKKLAVPDKRLREEEMERIHAALAAAGSRPAAKAAGEAASEAAPEGVSGAGSETGSASPSASPSDAGPAAAATSAPAPTEAPAPASASAPAPVAASAPAPAPAPAAESTAAAAAEPARSLATEPATAPATAPASAAASAPASAPAPDRTPETAREPVSPSAQAPVPAAGPAPAAISPPAPAPEQAPARDVAPAQAVEQ